MITRLVAGGSIAVLALSFVAAICAAVAWVFQLVWNIVAPIFHGPHLSYGQAFALWFLLSLIGGLFKANASK